MTIGFAWWLVLAAGTVAAVATARRRPQPAARLAVATFLVLVVAIAASGRAGGREAAFPARDALASAGGVEERAATRGEPVGAARGGQARRRRGPAALVRSYYAALDRGDFAAAWRRLSPAVRIAFGGFTAWRSGYATTLAHDIGRLRSGGGAVTHVLTAADRTPCGGTTSRRFGVTWRFEGSRAVALSAVKLSGADPASAC